MRAKDKVFLIGAGDHAKVVLSTLEACGAECVGIYDDNPNLRGKTLWSIPIIGAVSEMPDEPDIMCVIAIGSNQVRRSISERFKNVCWPVFVNPISSVHSSVRLGAGTIVFAGSLIESDASIGRHCIVGSGCFVGHDSVIGDYCQLAPGSLTGDNVSLGSGVLLGLGSIVKPYVKIYDGASVELGEKVIKDRRPEGIGVASPETGE